MVARRHIDRTLGAPINTFVIAAKTCISVLREEDAKEVRLYKRTCANAPIQVDTLGGDI